MSSRFGFVRKQWFLVALAIVIPGGFAIGYQVPAEAMKSLMDHVPSRAITAAVLFLMAWTMNSQHLRESFRHPWPVLWACLVNFGAIPLMALGLREIQTSPDYVIGIMVAGSGPCTMAAASVWTRKAGGNDAVSLLSTVLTNGLCFIITPLWINAATGGGVTLGVRPMVERLVVAVLVPLLLGQMMRLRPAFADFATRHKTPLGVVAQSLILVIVSTAALNAGARLAAGGEAPGAGSTLIVWVSCIALHLMGMWMAWMGCRTFQFSREDSIAVAFASSQKTLPVGILVANMFASVAPFATFPMLMYHASQLFSDTVIAGRFARGNNRPPTSDS